MLPKFKIVIPTYNNEQWTARCLMSIAGQTYKDFDCIVINDASTDKTKEILDTAPMILEDDRFRVVHNEENMKALYNIDSGFKLINAPDDPDSVLMVIDGDDFLFSEVVLELVANAYEKYDPLLTYGNHVHWPTGGMSNCEPMPNEVVENSSFRNHKFVTSHLRTFKSKLWYSIKEEDLKDDDGTFFGVGWDVAFMMPMLEMSHDRTLFIPNILYVYNRWNPISDDQIRQQDQARVEQKVRSMPGYSRKDF